ncbi:LexA/Signal peptidase, partial [Westerdykella ornata]
GIIATVGVTFIRDHIFSVDTVRGSSMAPSLSAEEHETGKRDFVWIRRLVPTAGLQRGDIITFWKPHRPGEISIKRVIGLSGDVVFPSRGYATVPSAERGKMVGLMDGLVEGGEEGGVLIPHNHVWVEGDNWRKSYDSNDFGPISMTLIDGKATKVWRGW